MSQRVAEISEIKDTLLKLQMISIIEFSESQSQAQVGLKYLAKYKNIFKTNSDISKVYIEKIERGPLKKGDKGDYESVVTERS